MVDHLILRNEKVSGILAATNQPYIQMYGSKLDISQWRISKICSWEGTSTMYHCWCTSSATTYLSQEFKIDVISLKCPDQHWYSVSDHPWLQVKFTDERRRLYRTERGGEEGKGASRWTNILTKVTKLSYFGSNFFDQLPKHSKPFGVKRNEVTRET